jgi:hypothetical protein
MAVRTGELRRWRPLLGVPEGTFLVLRCEGSFIPMGSRAGDPPQLHWSLLLQEGDVVTGWSERMLEQESELLNPSRDV